MKTTLEKLTEGGWKQTGYLGDCEIYRKEEDVILYQPTTEKIVFKFKDSEYKQEVQNEELK